MAKLNFSLVSPQRELFSGEVDQVDASGTEGDFGVLAGHAPFMTTLKEGRVKVYNDGDTLTFSAAITTPFPMTLEFTAKVEGDAMSGMVKAGSFGSFPITGTRA